MTDLFVQAVISRRQLPIMDYKISSGTYGSVGHAEFTTDLEALKMSGINLISDAEKLPGTLPLDIYANVGSLRYHIFGGEYVSGRWDYDHGTVSVHARDWAGVLADQKRVLSGLVAETPQSLLAPGEVSGTSVSNMNQSLSDLVTQIAKQFGLTPVLFLGGSGVGKTTSADPTMGVLYGGSDQIYWPLPSTTWGFLNKLARDTGNEVYVTPDKQLVFGLPGAGLTPVTLTWGIGNPPQGTYPCMDLTIEHNPRRNLSFRVLVLSYDPAKAQVTEGTAYVLGTDVNTNDQQTVKAGTWSGPEASLLNGLLYNAPGYVIPLYTFRVDGLTSAQAQTQALAIAQDIAKRELIVTCKVDELYQVLPMNPVKLMGPGVDPAFTGHNFWVNAYEHTFKMGSNGQAQAHTDLTLLDLRISGIGDAYTSGTKPLPLYVTPTQTSNPNPSSP